MGRGRLGDRVGDGRQCLHGGPEVTVLKRDSDPKLDRLEVIGSIPGQPCQRRLGPAPVRHSNRRRNLAPEHPRPGHTPTKPAQPAQQQSRQPDSERSPNSFRLTALFG